MEELRPFVRDVLDFPTPGIVFKDITPLLGDAGAFATTIEALAAPHRGSGIDKVVGIEARGFVFAAPVAHLLGAGFVPLRKAGKLPHTVVTADYALEYGSATLEVHADAFAAGDRVLVVDDVLATGGTAAAAVELVRQAGGTVAGLSFVIELGFLNGAERLGDPGFTALLRY